MLPRRLRLRHLQRQGRHHSHIFNQRNSIRSICHNPSRAPDCWCSPTKYKRCAKLHPLVPVSLAVKSLAGASDVVLAFRPALRIRRLVP